MFILNKWKGACKSAILSMHGNALQGTQSLCGRARNNWRAAWAQDVSSSWLQCRCSHPYMSPFPPA
eukprot:1157817-Pelagomonas_calceolata.AAC.23